MSSRKTWKTVLVMAADHLSMVAERGMTVQGQQRHRCGGQHPPHPPCPGRQDSRCHGRQFRSVDQRVSSETHTFTRAKQCGGRQLRAKTNKQGSCGQTHPLPALISSFGSNKQSVRYKPSRPFGSRFHPFLAGLAARYLSNSTPRGDGTRYHLQQ